jgi:hypothetical protein
MVRPGSRHFCKKALVILGGLTQAASGDWRIHRVGRRHGVFAVRMCTGLDCDWRCSSRHIGLADVRAVCFRRAIASSLPSCRGELQYITCVFSA